MNMDAPVTLKSLLEEHPEWADLPIVICSVDGVPEYIGASGAAFVGRDENSDVLMLSSN